MLSGFEGLFIWLSKACWFIAFLVVAITTGAWLLADAEVGIGSLIGPGIFLLLGWAFRVGARRIETNSLPELPVLGGYAFMGFGGAMVLGGIVMVIDDPAGFALMAFGLVFIGVGFAAKKLFATPEGKKAVTVGGYQASIQNRDGARGARAQANIIYVDEGACAEEEAGAKRGWLLEQWQRRPDWVEGRVEGEDKRSGSLGYWAALAWSIFALGAVAAGFLWGGMAWWVAMLAGAVATVLVLLALRVWWRRRKFGDSYLTLDHSPLALGDKLVGTVETGVTYSKMKSQTFHIECRCVHSWEETDYSGPDDSRRRFMHSDVLWEVSRDASGIQSSEHDKLLVPIEFELPNDQPGATLESEYEGIQWELIVKAELAGLDYQARFKLPVFQEDIVEVIRSHP